MGSKHIYLFNTRLKKREEERKKETITTMMCIYAILLELVGSLDLSNESFTKEQHRAALAIQKIFRGFLSRKWMDCLISESQCREKVSESHAKSSIVYIYFGLLLL